MCAATFHKFVVIIIIGRIKYVESVYFHFPLWLRAYTHYVCDVRLPSHSQSRLFTRIVSPTQTIYSFGPVVGDIEAVIVAVEEASICRFVLPMP